LKLKTIDTAARFCTGHPFFGSIDWRKLESKSYSAPVVPTIRHELDLGNFDKEFTDAKLVESMRDATESTASARHFSGFTFGHADGGGGGFVGESQLHFRRFDIWIAYM
jgi:hypothetical protein